jgi:hypothetical protein
VQKLAHKRLDKSSNSPEDPLATPVPRESSPLLPSHREHVLLDPSATNIPQSIALNDPDLRVDILDGFRPQSRKGKANGDGARAGPTDYFRSKLWWFGLSFMAAGEVGNFLCAFYCSLFNDRTQRLNCIRSLGI